MYLEMNICFYYNVMRSSLLESRHDIYIQDVVSCISSPVCHLVGHFRVVFSLIINERKPRLHNEVNEIVMK